MADATGSPTAARRPPLPVPGHDDGWSLVQNSTRPTGPTTPAAPTATTSLSHTGPESGPTTAARRLRWPLVAAGTAALVVAAGGVAYAQAHKTVALDVDGEITRVSTFAGSVEGLLTDHEVEVGARDTVSHTGPLSDGAEIVVRHATALVVDVDGTRQVVWTTALSADEALESLSDRAATVALVASRSAERAELPLDLALRGRAEVLVDGAVLPVPDADATVATVLDELAVALQPLDRVHVQQSAAGVVQVVVRRVVEQDVATTSEVPFTSRTEDDASRYVGQKTVAQAGVPGVRTVVERVTTVDGVEEARVPVSDGITQAPVEEVVRVGTKPRPVVAAAPASGASAAAGPIAAGGSADSLNWAALAKCESGGRVDVVSSTGKYHGLYQFSVSTWQSVGGAGLPSQASAEEQTARAKMLYNRSGAGQWPHCGKYLFS
ncbi:Transglycosylase domain protein [Cellulomonas flavigena DSM 20109]|uniref:Transglycosylase domain protein n=1 Tax=Cellulomonas flavigena (strain ATCC 482 / DSM 20109 / BCRC 11376 / JCM 18109 / NBRC 3775 / NCIMB 8073 / NRS 134) TaxID=446466 RepID=D5UK21_CELFN|nr:resuscitation-promoting factor [Cellulomonas flavigena]ADG73763.1 Transglycosylase domain protein [Cellulomonas flavigena DSM 20109]